MASTRILARHVAGLRFKDLPERVVARAKAHLLDGLGCLLAGTRGGPARAATDMLARLGTKANQANIYTGCTRGSARDAAFANAMSLYSVGLNDVHTASVAHPGGCVIPVVLAIGEWQSISGGDMLAAMVAGYEVTARIGRSVMPSHRERGFHATGTFGTFGASAAAARLLRLDAEQTANTFGIAGSQAAGLFEFHRDGALTMVFHAARAAQNGVESALLTLGGLTGPYTVLEGDRGFCRATSNVFDETALTSGLGEHFEIEETSFRPYYGCSSTIAASGATATLMRKLGVKSPDEVASINVCCHKVVAHDNVEADPQTLLAARLSMPFNVSLVLARGDVVTADVYESDLRDPLVRASLDLVHLHEDASMPRFGCSLNMKLRDGRSAEVTNLLPRGDARHPLTWEDVVEKFCRLTSTVLHDSGASGVIEAVRNLENSDGAALALCLRDAIDVLD